MKKKAGNAYYSMSRRHFCTPIDDLNYKDLTTGEQFIPVDGDIRSVMPEDLLDSTILLELDEKSQTHYIRVSYNEVSLTTRVNNQVSVDVDSSGRLIGVRLTYPWPSR